MKSLVSQRYALSCKFKGNWIEVAVTNKITGAIQIELIPIKDDVLASADKEVLAPATDTEDESEGVEEVSVEPKQPDETTGNLDKEDADNGN